MINRGTAMTTKDFYEDFAGRYDLPGDTLDRHDPQLVEFFRTLFEKHGVHSILDCACGTGRHLMLFQDIGIEVWGSDISPSMLEQAQNNLDRHGVDIPLRQCDYRELRSVFEREFDAVACLGSIGYMSNEEEILQAFHSMLSVLRSGGILILTTLITDKQWSEKPRFQLVADTVELTRLFVMDYLEQSVRYHILDAYHSLKASELKVWSTELTPLLRDAQECLLDKAGFRKVEFFGAYDLSSYEKQTNSHLITVAMK